MTLRLAYRMPGAVRPLVQSALVQREREQMRIDDRILS